MSLLSDRTLLDFGMALSTAMLIADTIKSAYLSQSLVDVSSEKSSEHSAASSFDSNTSLSVWSNLYLVWLADEFLCGRALIEISIAAQVVTYLKLNVTFCQVWGCKRHI